MLHDLTHHDHPLPMRSIQLVWSVVSPHWPRESRAPDYIDVAVHAGAVSSVRSVATAKFTKFVI